MARRIKDKVVEVWIDNEKIATADGTDDNISLAKALAREYIINDSEEKGIYNIEYKMIYDEEVLIATNEVRIKIVEKELDSN